MALDNARLLAETRSALIGLEHANAALREQRRTSNWPCWPTTGSPNWCCAAAGSPRWPPNWPMCWAARSSCRCRRQADEPIGPGQSSVPVSAGSEVLGRLVLTRDGAPRPADLRVLERGAVVTALLLLFNRHLAEVANRGRRDLLEDLLTGSVIDPDEIAARAADLDADLTGDLVVVVCALPRHRADAEQAAVVLRRPAARTVGSGRRAPGAAAAR